MAQIGKILARMRAAPAAVRFEDVAKVCGHHFGEPRQNGTSHKVYRTPWAGDPRVNIQCGDGGKAKAYQVKQVMAAIDRIEGKENGDDDND